MASVASFFVSRIDSLVDARLEEQRRREARRERPDSWRCAARWRSPTPSWPIASLLSFAPRRVGCGVGRRGRRAAAAALGVDSRPRIRPIRDAIYVEELIGRDTVNTVPPETIDAFRDHGVARATLGARHRGGRGGSGRARALGRVARRRDRPPARRRDRQVRAAVREAPRGDRKRGRASSRRRNSRRRRRKRPRSSARTTASA